MLKNRKGIIISLTIAAALTCSACAGNNTQQSDTSNSTETSNADSTAQTIDANSAIAQSTAQADSTETAISDSTTSDITGQNTDTSTTDSSNVTETELPPYEYPGPELFYSVLYSYLIDELSPYYSEADVCIPCPVIVHMDEEDNNDIKVYGNFWIFNYDLNGDILENTSGGSYPGCIHLKSTDKGYEVTSMEVVEDGSNYTESAKEIFGEYYDAFVETTSDSEQTESIRAQIIANYVAANNLSITAYQDYGWDPVTLPEENIDSFYSTFD